MFLLFIKLKTNIPFMYSFSDFITSQEFAQYQLVVYDPRSIPETLPENVEQSDTAPTIRTIDGHHTYKRLFKFEVICCVLTC